MRKGIVYIKKCMFNNKKIFFIISILVLFGLIYIIPHSFASLQPVRSVEIFSEKLNYQNNEPGAWKVTKRAKWFKKGNAEITIDVESVLKNSNKNLDILFAINESEYVGLDKVNLMKENINYIIENILNNNSNRVSLVGFSESSNISTSFTKDKNELINKINSITTINKLSFYYALKNVEKIMKDYKKEENRECIVLFLTSSYSSLNLQSEIGEYSYLKNHYPYMTIKSVQYEMGSDILGGIKKISDVQYVSDTSNLKNVLLEATDMATSYTSFKLEDYIDSDYFIIEKENDIKASKGEVDFDVASQKVIWTISDFKTGQNITLKIKAKLKNDLLNIGGIYSTNRQEKIHSNINGIEEDITKSETPIISDKYRVNYNANAPEGCIITGFPKTEYNFVYDTVMLSASIPRCEGYQFKGWNIITKGINKVNDDYFIMPESDVEIKAEWSKISINKSMEGTIGEALTLYRQVELDANDSTKYAKEYVGDTSTFNGKEKVYYYHGNAANNNVIFADYCWKIVRTTDTGGVKLLYNGVPSGGRCNNTGDASQLTASQMNLSTNQVTFNSVYRSPADVGYMYNTRYENYSKALSTVGTVLYGNGFVYNNGSYTLKNTKLINTLQNYTDISNYHYTCFNTSGTCSTLSYVFNYLSSNKTLNYMNLTYGKSIENILNEMLYDNDVNKYNSPIKSAIDNWFKNNMISYSSYLEDTTWCNDRSMRSQSTNGWNSNGGNIEEILYFGSINNSSDLICPNKIDAFTVDAKNGNGDLTYPTGLITRQEIYLSYENNKSPLFSGNIFWSMSPFAYRNCDSLCYLAFEFGDCHNSIQVVTNTRGVRPAVSLKSSIEYANGDGSTNSPYIIVTD